MAAQVDSMSDAELRTKLAEHGFPVMPITASTRKLLVKKLKLVLDNKSQPRSSVDSKLENRRNLARYSSGEESDIDLSNNKEKRRKTISGGSMLPPVTRKSRQPTPKKDTKQDSKGSDSEDEKTPIKTHEEVETVTTRRVTRTYAAEDYETGSDSDIDLDKKTSTPTRTNSRSSDYISSTFPTNDLTTNTPKPTIFSRPSISLNNTSSMTSSEHLNSIRSRLGLNSTMADRPSVSTFTSRLSSDHPFKPSVDEVESPYSSRFSPRLSTLKPGPSTSSYFKKDINNGSSTLPHRSYIPSFKQSFDEYKTEKKFFKSNTVSLALVFLVAIFFLGLFFMYMVKKNDIRSIVDDHINDVPICRLKKPENRPGINCVPEDQVNNAKDLLKIIHPELTSRMAAFKCGAIGIIPYMTEKDVLDFADKKAENDDISQIRMDLNNLEVMLINNPSCGVSIVKLDNKYSKDEKFTPLNSVEDIIMYRGKGILALAMTNMSTPLSCFIVNALYSAGNTLAIICISTISIFGLQWFYKYYTAYKKQKSNEIYSMVEQIIDVISQETQDSGEPYISVDHVRDTLISPQSREKMASVWDAAIKFIQKNESRVRMEVQTVDGEDCRVWRWISSHSPKRCSTWQGQAFETQEGSVNNLIVAPTPCLKIRHMFDKNDTNPNLRSTIQDAIIEKCGDHCNILHIDIERTSCCVYVKCATSVDAGVVYRNLHGWWYDGNLITVKYLRLERYMQRFPNSPSAGPYLKHSQAH